MKNDFSQRLPARYTQMLLNMLVAEYEIDPDNLARLQDLCRPLVEIPEGFITLEQFAQACDIAADSCDDTWLGFKFGQRLSPISLGALGAAASSCYRVDEMFALIGKFADTLLPAHIESQVKGDSFLLKSTFPPHIDKNREFHAQVLVASALKLLEDLVGYLPRDISIYFPFADHKDYRQYFPYNLYFNSPTLSLEFPISYMRAPLLSSDPVAHELYVKACETISQQLESSRTLGTSIRQLLEGYQGSYPSLEQIADMLHVSSRTLRNRLAKEQLSYRQLLASHRVGKAKKLLESRAMTVADIAEQLGYRDTANFCRAFKRETGLPPSDYRTRGSLSGTAS